jgi:PPOX class probable F420-dependent enzyme
VRKAEALDLVARAPLGRLATVRPDGRPHIVPVTYAIAGETIATMVDHKPKTTTRLQRLANITANPAVSLLVDEWSDDWDRLWWVRIDGSARIHYADDEWRTARTLLQSRYHQYQDHPPQGPAIVIAIDRVTGWAGSG